MCVRVLTSVRGGRLQNDVYRKACSWRCGVHVLRGDRAGSPGRGEDRAAALEGVRSKAPSPRARRDAGRPQTKRQTAYVCTKSE